MLKASFACLLASVVVLQISACEDAGEESPDSSTVGDPVVPGDGGAPVDGAAPRSDASTTWPSDGAVWDAGTANDASTTSDAAQSNDAGSTGDAGGTSDAGSTTAPKPKCMKKDSQLIVIGDSYINWTSHTFPQDIVRESGQKWRMEAVGGTSMGSGGLGSIPQQFYDSIARDPDAHSVLMDGGGNDVLVPDLTNAFFGECSSKGASTKANCQKIVTVAIAAAEKLRDKAAAAGIRDVVYFFYPHVPANTILSGNDPAEILDYALPKVKGFCEGMEAATAGKTRCTFIDLIPIFAGHNDWYNEDIHENSKGSAAIAKEVWRVMTDKCIGQKGPKDCCE